MPSQHPFGQEILARQKESKMSQMDLGPQYRPRTSQQREVDEFKRALPDRVVGTQARILECNGHILVVRHFDHAKEPSGAQRKLFKAMVALGENPDAPGNVTVLCLWGRVGLPVAREMQVYDHMGVGSRKVATDDEITAGIRQWWLSRGGKP